MSKKVKLNLHVLMGKHKVRSINHLSNETGITRQTLTRLYDEKAKQLDFDTIAKLCTYFDCDVSELLVLEEAPEEKGED